MFALYVKIRVCGGGRLGNRHKGQDSAPVLFWNECREVDLDSTPDNPN